MNTTDKRTAWEYAIESAMLISDEEQISRSFYGLLRKLRRTIAKDGPHQRPAGSLEAFDEACDKLGIPFIEP
jgi:hypothetical protein